MIERPQIRDFQNDDTYDMNWGRFAGAMRIYCDHLEIRLKEAEEALSWIAKAVDDRPGFQKYKIFCAIGAKAEKALKGLGQKPCYICKGINGQHELFCSRGRQEGKS